MASSVPNAKSAARRSLKQSKFTRPRGYINALHDTHLADEGNTSIEEVEGEALWHEVCGLWTYFRRADPFFNFVNIVLENFTADEAIDALVEYRPIPSFKITRRHHFRAIARYLNVSPSEQLRRIDPFLTALFQFAQSNVDPRLQVDTSQTWIPPSEEDMSKRMLTIFHFGEATLDPQERYVELRQLSEDLDDTAVTVIPETKRTTKPEFQIHDDIADEILAHVNDKDADIPREPLPLTGVLLPAQVELDRAMAIARIGDKIGYLAKIRMAKDNGRICSHDGPSCLISKSVHGRNQLQSAVMARIGHLKGTLKEHEGGSYEELCVALIYILNINNTSILKGYISRQWRWSQDIVDDVLEARSQRLQDTQSLDSADNGTLEKQRATLTCEIQDQPSIKTAQRNDDEGSLTDQGSEKNVVETMVPAKRSRLEASSDDENDDSRISGSAFHVDPEAEDTARIDQLEGVFEDTRDLDDHIAKGGAVKRLKLSPGNFLTIAVPPIPDSTIPLATHSCNFPSSQTTRKYIRARLDRLFPPAPVPLAPVSLAPIPLAPVNVSSVSVGRPGKRSKGKKQTVNGTSGPSSQAGSSIRSALQPVSNNSSRGSGPTSLASSSRNTGGTYSYTGPSRSSARLPTTNFTFTYNFKRSNPPA